MREAELVALDRDQLEVLDLVEHNPRFVVLGGPGTGKTVVAAEVTRRFARAGRRPLLLCWTRALASALRESGIAEAWTVRELAADLLAKAGVSMQSGAPTSAWTTPP